MQLLVWAGALLAAAGFLGVLWSALLVVRARGARLPEPELRARLARALPLNLGAFGLSVLGLLLVVVGVLLG